MISDTLAKEDLDTRKMHFTLIMNQDEKNVNIHFSKINPTIPEVLDEVLSFMKACGYNFNSDDSLGIVNKHTSFDTMVGPIGLRNGPINHMSDLELTEI